MIRPDVTIPFDHQQSAHCETGVISNLMRFHGLPVSEPMAFGIGSGLFYSHMPFLKMNGIPVTSYRILPGWIFGRFTKKLGIAIKRMKFRDPKAAMDELEAATRDFAAKRMDKSIRRAFAGKSIDVLEAAGESSKNVGEAGEKV